MVSKYTINEEIVRQTLEVKFKINSKSLDEWFICFSNPTAGPWKKISFNKKDGKIERIGGYEKEEKRPDLIIFSRKYKLLLIIEAKDVVSGLIKESDKIEETFKKEYDKLSKMRLMKEEFSSLFVINGLVFFSKSANNETTQLIKEYKHTRNLIIFLVDKAEDNLIIKFNTKISDKKIEPLNKLFLSKN